MKRILPLVRSLAVRYLREGFVLRALVWPSALCVATILITAGGYAYWGTAPYIVVENEQLASAFERDGFRVAVEADPAKALTEGRTVRAAWREHGRYILGQVFGGPNTLRAEAILRDEAHAAWRIEVPKLEGRPADVDAQTGLMAATIALLYALYGCVMGAGALYRDRASGALEGELSLPVPRAAHAVSRLLALGMILAPALAGSLLLLHSILPIHRIGEWIGHGALAAVTGGAIGLGVMASAAREQGFSAPLTRALTTTLILLALGWSFPKDTGWMPVSSLAALVHGGSPSGLALLPALLIAAFAVRRYSQSETL